MSLDMADRMVVMGISANIMMARAVKDRKNTSHLIPALTQIRTNKGFPSSASTPSPCGLGSEALDFSAGSTLSSPDSESLAFRNGSPT